jgi:hypothetical protein
MVPFLYLVYARTGASLSAQTVVAHATSLGVAFFTSAVATWRYAKTGGIAWRAAFAFAVPGILSAFVTARILTKADEAAWVRAAFGAFLLFSAWDLARRARATSEPPAEPHPHSWIWLVLFGLVAGVLSALLGIGGGLIAVPVLLYIGKLPVRAIAPTALAGVCLTTLAGGLAYATAGPGPLLSPLMTGFLDFRMLVPLVLGAVLTVPMGVWVNRRSSAATLYWLFAMLLAGIGLLLVWGWARGALG